MSMHAPCLSVHSVRHYEPCLVNSLGSPGSYNPSSFLQQEFPEFCLINFYGSVHLLLSAAGRTSLRIRTNQWVQQTSSHWFFFLSWSHILASSTGVWANQFPVPSHPGSVGNGSWRTTYSLANILHSLGEFPLANTSFFYTNGVLFRKSFLVWTVSRQLWIFFSIRLNTSIFSWGLWFLSWCYLCRVISMDLVGIFSMQTSNLISTIA